MLGSALPRGLLLLALAGSHIAASATQQQQQVLGAHTGSGGGGDDTGAYAEHDVVIDVAAVTAALEAHADPVDAFVALRPDAARTLAEPRLLHVRGEERPRWMTEGDKLRLRRRHQKFMDITDHHGFYTDQVDALSGQARKCARCPGRPALAFRARPPAHRPAHHRLPPQTSPT